VEEKRSTKRVSGSHHGISSGRQKTGSPVGRPRQQSLRSTRNKVETLNQPSGGSGGGERKSRGKYAGKARAGEENAGTENVRGSAHVHRLSKGVQGPKAITTLGEKRSITGRTEVNARGGHRGRNLLRELPLQVMSAKWGGNGEKSY